MKWNKSLDFHKKGTVIISDSDLVFQWFSEHFSYVQQLATTDRSPEEALGTQPFNVIIIDCDMTDNEQWISTTFKLYPYATKIALTKYYRSEKSLELFRKGASQVLLFPPPVDSFTHVLSHESMLNNAFQKMEFLYEKFQQFMSISPSSTTSVLHTLLADRVDNTNRDRVLKEKVDLVKTLQEAKKEALTGEELMTIFPIRLLDDAESLASIKQLLTEAFDKKTYRALVRNNPTIMIIEDEALFRETLSDYLGRYTDNIVTAASGDEVIEKISVMEQLDLKLMDIDLPGKSGVELLPIINKRFPTSQSIMITAYDDYAYVETCFAHNVFDYIVKPVELQPLVAKISKALQMKGLRSLMAIFCHSLIESLSRRDREELLNELIQRQLDHQQPITMDDITLLFPECVTNTIPGHIEIPIEVLEDGIGLFVNAVLYQKQENKDCLIILKDWRSFVSGLV